MEMKQYMLDTFWYNDHANKMVLEKIKQLPDGGEAVKFFSHLINSQNKWMARIIQDPKTQEMDWWKPVYPLEELEERWNKSFHTWIDFLNNTAEERLFEI